MITLIAVLLLSGCSEKVTESMNDGGQESGPKARVAGQEVRHGVWRGYYPDGARKYVVRYTRGVPTGLYRGWYPNGVLSDKSIYDWEGSISKRTTYDLNGHKMESYDREKLKDNEEPPDAPPAETPLAPPEIQP